jgi:HAD superfamily hydrolase (TIGR01509 family)
VVESFQHEVHDLSASQYVDEYMEVMNDLYPRIKKWPGTLRVLRELKNRGFPMAIATSSPRYSFDKKMEFHPEILELMDAVVTGDEIQRGKPNPDIFLEAARRIQCNPANILVFEDSPFGIQGALEAGAHTVALPDPRLLQGTAEKFSKLSSTWTLDRIGEFDTSNIKRIDRRAKTSIFQTQQALAPSVEGISSPRDEIFKLTASVAKMASSLEHCHSCHVRNKESAYFDMLRQILRTAKSCQVDLGDACISKIEINKMKYPANLCRGKAGKYTAYTAATGIDKKTWQNSQGTAVMSKNISFEEVRDDVRDFVAARDWEKFHTPRNICLALIGELGELAELFQWKGDVQDPVFVGLSTFTSEESDKVKQELADVAVYAIRLGDLLGYSFDRI